MGRDRDSFSRRDFLWTGAVAAGAMALPRASWAASFSYDKKLRIGIVGGRFGASFQFHEHPGCIVEAVSDLRPERRDRLMKTYGCEKSHESLETLILDPAIDAVGVFTEAPNHVPHCIAALEAGKHVLCAVPVAMTLEECEELIAVVKKTGLTFMMAETSYWQQTTISARKFYEEGAFGDLYSCHSAYHHAGLETLWFENGKPTWRHGFPPMHYPTHCTAHLVSVSGERLNAVSCIGWGDDSPELEDNPYKNPFWNESAQFETDRENVFNVEVWWKGAHGGGERAEWYGDQMSLLSRSEYGEGPFVVRAGAQTELDSGGFDRARPDVEVYEQPEWWATDMLPEPLRHNSGHEGSHCFITHEFIDAVLKQRKPAVDVYEAVAYTAPGIVAHQSALKGGERLKIKNFG